MSRYRDPLLSAAFDLQSRLYNIATGLFLETYLLDHEDAGADSYAKASTLWLIAQYLGWVEILRRDIQFLDLGLVERNRRLQDCLAAVEREFASDNERLGRELRIFRADQRAIGELMIVESRESQDRLRTRGYADFTVNYTDSDYARWLNPVADDLRLIVERAGVPLRLRRLQGALVQLVDELDPERVRYSNPNVRGWLLLPAGNEPYRRSPERYLARFLVEPDIVDPWGPFSEWLERFGMAASAERNDLQFATRSSLVHGQLNVRVCREDNWMTIEAWQSHRFPRKTYSRDEGSEFVTSRVHLATVNALLEGYGRPQVRAARRAKHQ